MCRSGVGTNLKYIDQEDIASEKVRVRTAEERAQDSEYNVEPDADDMGVLRSRSPQLPGAEDSQKLVSVHSLLCFPLFPSFSCLISPFAI
jgi:hypothetical protein